MKKAPSQRRPVVVILDDDPGFCGVVSRLLRETCEVVAHGTDGDLLEWLREGEPDLLLLDVVLSPAGSTGRDGFAVLEEIRSRGHTFPVVVMTVLAGMDVTSRAVQLGVPFLQKGADFSPDTFRQTVFQVIESRRLRSEISFWRRFVDTPPRVRGCPWPDSPAGKAVLGPLQTFADNNLPVLFEGERGTGKRTTAMWLHSQRGSGDRPFLIVSPLGRSDETCDRDLFGSEPDGGTGWRGVLGAVEGSTVYLDEFERWPVPTLVRLAQALRSGVYSPSGSARRIRVVSRVMVGRVRSGKAPINWDESLELFWKPYRVLLPPIREHRDDLVFHIEFLRSHLAAEGVTCPEPDARMISILRKLDLRGNGYDLRAALIRGAEFAAAAEDDEPHAETVWERLAAYPKMRYDDYVLMKYLRAVDRRLGRNLQAWIDHTGYERTTIFRWWARLNEDH